MPSGDQGFLTPDGPQQVRDRTARYLYHDVVTVTKVGATDRTQADPGKRVFSVTLQAPSGNTGKVYIGDKSVTNSSGGKIGFALSPGVDYGPIGIEQPKLFYVAADTANDKLVIFGVG